MIQIIFQSSLHFHKKKLLFLRKISTSSKEIRRKKKQLPEWDQKLSSNSFYSRSSFKLTKYLLREESTEKLQKNNCKTSSRRSKVSFDLYLDRDSSFIEDDRKPSTPMIGGHIPSPSCKKGGIGQHIWPLSGNAIYTRRWPRLPRYITQCSCR